MIGAVDRCRRAGGGEAETEGSCGMATQTPRGRTQLSPLQSNGKDGMETQSFEGLLHETRAGIYLLKMGGENMEGESHGTHYTAKHP